MAKIENTPASILIELVIIKNKEDNSPRNYKIKKKWNKPAIQTGINVGTAAIN